MRILFVLSEVILSEPMGVMQLSAICKKHGHDTKLCVLRNHDFLIYVQEYRPDIIAYSCMSSDIDSFKQADSSLLESFQGALPFRIMGGAHPTFFKEVLSEMGLDAICVGEGDFAFIKLIENIHHSLPTWDIPNILTPDTKQLKKELPQCLDELPFLDRDIFYEAMPRYRSVGLRSFLTARGCAFNCTYCYVSSYNNMFKDVGPIVRRRSVDNLINEILHVKNNYPEMRLVRFSDDTFIYKVDDWFLEFVKQYKEKVNLPFYCLMRSNVFTEEVASLLKEAGCHAISMSIESANPKLRAKVLGRHIPDKTIRRSFELAKKYRINTYANTMLGIPGSSFSDDIASFKFARDLKVSAPTYSIFCPYPNLPLTDYALKEGYIDGNYRYAIKYGEKSVLNCFSEREKNMQVRLQHIGPFFSTLPKFFTPLLFVLLRLPLDRLYQFFGAMFEIWILSTKIFKNIYPKNPIRFTLVLIDSLFYAHKSSRLRGLFSIFKLEGGTSTHRRKLSFMNKYRP